MTAGGWGHYRVVVETIIGQCRQDYKSLPEPIYFWILIGCHKSTPLFKSNILLQCQNIVFSFNVWIWNYACCMMRSFTSIVENIISIQYTITPEWAFKCCKVWKKGCLNDATWTNIWRYFLAVPLSDFSAIIDVNYVLTNTLSYFSSVYCLLV